MYCSVNATAGCKSFSFTTSLGDVPANNFCSEIVGLKDLTETCEIELLGSDIRTVLCCLFFGISGGLGRRLFTEVTLSVMCTISLDTCRIKFSY